MIRILLVDDHSILREGLKIMLKGQEEICLVGEAGNGKEAIEIISKLNVDIVFMDIDMPVMNGLEATGYLRQHNPGIKVLILSMLANQKSLKAAFDAGACGYLLKNSNKEELLTAIRHIEKSGTYISSRISIDLLNKFKQHRSDDNQFKLSERELRILNLIGEGFTNDEIGEKVFLSKRSIENYRKILIDKTGTSNTATLIKFAVENDLLD